LLCCTTTTHRYAKEAGVRVTTFDTASELHKIADMHPGFACVLRIRCDDEGAKINLGLKYGADDGDVPGLLALAKSLGLQVCMCVVCVIVRARVSCPGMVGMFHMCM
jgi:ornithine decarboxylase